MYQINPARVIQQAQLNGLRALVTLLRYGATPETQHLVERAADRLNTAIDSWLQSKADGNPDFALVTRKEKDLRNVELESFWITAKKYGSSEHKRIRNEKQGVVGPLNRMLNIVGAQARDHHIFMWPMQEAEMIVENGIKRGWGYYGVGPTENVLLGHGPVLPEFDLVDMTRSHNRELARKAFILRVQPHVLSRYALLMNRRFTSFVDYTYTHGVHGSSTFKRPRHRDRENRNAFCADDILRSIENELRALYGIEVALPPKPSAGGTHTSKSGIEGFFSKQITRLREQAVDAPPAESTRLSVWADLLNKMTEGDDPRLREKDDRRLYREFKRRARYAGIVHHRFVLSGLPSPRNIESVVLRGDRFLKKGDDLLIISELKLDTPRGSGRADIVVFKRERLASSIHPELETVLRPIAVFDIKTKSAYTWEIQPKKSRTGQKRKKVFPRFIIRQRTLTDEEWEEAITQVPRKNTDSVQLEHYKKGLLMSYREQTGDSTYDDLMTGIILLDANEDVKLHRDGILELIESLRTPDVRRKFATGCQKLVIRDRAGVLKRAALIIDNPTTEQAELLRISGEPLNEPVIYNPFSESMKKENQHILYLSARAASKSGRTASWIGRYYHGMQYLASLLKERESAKVLWLDLAGMFGIRSLAEIRLRIGHQNEKIRQMFQSIDIRDVSKEVNDFLFHGGILLDIRARRKSSINGPNLIVVSGWDMVKNSCPPRLERALQELERSIVIQVNEAANTVLWFDEAVKDEFKSGTYHQSTLIPFRDDSPHRHYVKRIVWNLPVKPFALHHSSPMLDDLRVVTEHDSSKVRHELVEIPPLENWSTKLRGRHSKNKDQGESHRVWGRRKLTPADVMVDRTLSTDLMNTANELIPWLEHIYPTIEQTETTRSRIAGITLQVIPLYGEPAEDHGILSRVIYRGNLQGGQAATTSVVKAAQTLNKTIKHPRHYRRRKAPKVREIRHSSRSPDEVLMEYRSFDEHRAAELEMRRFKQMIGILEKDNVSEQDSGLRELIQYLGKMISTGRVGPGIVRQLSELLARSQPSQKLWERLLWIREKTLVQGLRLKQKERVDALLETRPDLSTSYGNYLVLLILAASTGKSMSEEDLKLLWETVKSWQLEQMGLYVPQNASKTTSRFNARAVLFNLRKRVSILSRLPSPTQTSVRFGQIWMAAEREEPGFWVFLEDKYRRNELVSGLFLGGLPFSLVSTMQWSEMDHAVITDHADFEQIEWVQDIVVAEVKGIEYIWALEEEDWVLIGRFQMVPRKRNALTRIWGLGCVSVGSNAVPDAPRFVNRSVKFRDRIYQEMKRLAKLESKVMQVTCDLSIRSGRYVVAFFDGKERVSTVRTASTAEILELLRTPLVDGLPISHPSVPNQFLTWNPYTDIDYMELQLLRPYVERKRPYIHIEVPLPETAETLASRPVQDVDLTLCHDQSLCPVADGSADSHGDCWRVVHSAQVSDPDLVKLGESALSETDVVSLLSAGEVIFERGRYRLNITCEHDPESREGVVFRESWRIAKAFGLSSIRAGAYLKMDNEELIWSFLPERCAARIPLKSSVTGEKVAEEIIQFERGIEWEIDEAIDIEREKLEEVAADYFHGDEREGGLRIQDFDDLMVELEDWFLNVKMEEVDTGEDDRDALELKLEVLRRFAERDPVRKFDVAETLLSLAKLEEKKRVYRDALPLIEEVIVLLRSYVEVWRDEAAKALLDEAQQLRQKITKT